MTEEAIEILKAAASGNGHVSKVFKPEDTSSVVRAGSEEFDVSSHRARTFYYGALDDLVEDGFIIPESRWSNSEYEVTRKGYRKYDDLILGIE